MANVVEISDESKMSGYINTLLSVSGESFSDFVKKKSRKTNIIES